MSRTSSKGNFKPKRKRVFLTCPTCGTRFSLNPSEYKRIEAGTRGPGCSISCGKIYANLKKKEIDKKCQT